MWKYNFILFFILISLSAYAETSSTELVKINFRFSNEECFVKANSKTKPGTYVVYCFSSNFHTALKPITNAGSLDVTYNLEGELEMPESTYYPGPSARLNILAKTNYKGELEQAYCRYSWLVDNDENTEKSWTLESTFLVKYKFEKRILFVETTAYPRYTMAAKTTGRFNNNDNIHGLYQEFYNSDLIKTIGRFTNNIQTGVWSNFDQDGTIDSYGPYINGEKNGLWHEESSIMAGLYSNDNKVGWWRPDTNKYMTKLMPKLNELKIEYGSDVSSQEIMNILMEQTSKFYGEAIE